jgi:hypothetical protein
MLLSQPFRQNCPESQSASLSHCWHNVPWVSHSQEDVIGVLGIRARFAF